MEIIKIPLGQPMFLVLPSLMMKTHWSKGVGTLDIVDLAQSIGFYSQNTLVVIINGDSFG